MSIDKNHSEQYRKYLNGDMSPEKANAFERKALDDPFAQDALEGLEDADPEISFENMDLLKKQIASKSTKGIAWMRIAAVVALLIVSSFALWFAVDQTGNTSELAVQEASNPANEIDSADSQSIDLEESELIAEVLEESTVKTFKKDEVKVVDKLELADEEMEEIEEELAPLQTLAEANVPIEKIIELDNETMGIALKEEINNIESAPMEQALQGRVAGVQIVESKSTIADFSEIDSSELDTDLLSQSLVAKESIAEDSFNDSSKKLARSSAARSASVNYSTVTGKVTDDSGEALPGVNVLIKGTVTGVQTNLEGNYTIPRTDGMTLIYSFVGFESQEVEVGARTSLDVSMGGATELQEVVVTNYGVSEKESIPSYSPAKPTIGNRKYNNYLKDSLQYPTEAKSNEIEGTIILELTISSNGKISNIDIKKSLGYGCDEEAIRLVNEGPKWNSAERDGVKVEEKARLKVKFKLKSE